MDDSACTPGTPSIGVGHFDLQTPLGTRKILHAAVAAKWSKVALPTVSVPVPQAKRSIIAAPYAGSATCDNLLGASTKSALEAKGISDSGQSWVAQVSSNPEDSFYPFVANSDLVCSWAPDNGEAAVMFAYGPISDSSAASEKAALKQKWLESVGGRDYDLWKVPGGTGRGYAFGNGYWAYAYDNGGGYVLDEIIANAPKF